MLVVVIFLAIVLIFLNIYFLMYYCNPDDEGFGLSIWPKIIVVLGLTLAFSQILIIPLDASNNRGEGYGMRLDIIWQVVLIGVISFSIILAPFTLFWYEADDEETCCSKFCHAFKMLFFLMLILAIVFVVSGYFFNKAEIPIKEITLEFKTTQDTLKELIMSSNSDTKMTMEVSYIIYVVAVFSWFGWYIIIKK